MIKFKDWLLITGAGFTVYLAYENDNGFFYKGALKDAPPIDGDLEVVSQYVHEDDGILRVVLK